MENCLMMGQESPLQQKLFYSDINLEDRLRSNHPLRKIAEIIDFSFAYEVVADCYGKNGNVSVPPPVLLKLMLLLVFYNVRSERELMQTLPERLDWLWFLGYDLDSSIPNHSVLSKARNRWGEEVFREFFERIVWQCVEAGLVDGSKIFMDSSLIEANASCNSIVNTKSLKRLLNKRYLEMESRLDDIQEKSSADRPDRKVNNSHISTTDPEAGIVRSGKPKLYYKTHRAVEEHSEIITAVEVTTGDINEAHHMDSLWKAHGRNTEHTAKTIVADSKYGTTDNYLYCDKNNLQAHIPDLKTKAEKKKKREIFSAEKFFYDPKIDAYVCPAGNLLKRRAYHKSRNRYEYRASKQTCLNCSLREQCTKNKTGRTIKRHIHQEKLDTMRLRANTTVSKKDIKKRQHLMERSFARAKRYGYDRARWRGRWRVSIQELLICAVQNIQILMTRKTKPLADVVQMRLEKPISVPYSRIELRFYRFHHTLTKLRKAFKTRVYTQSCAYMTSRNA